MRARASGILAHPTSLPSPFGIGDLGPHAYRFADFLAEAGQNVWQILPLNPTSPGSDHAPYSSVSAFAGNPLLISPEELVRDGLLDEADIQTGISFPDGSVSYDLVFPWKMRVLDLAFQRFLRLGGDRDFEEFQDANREWLEDFALYQALKSENGGKAWPRWPRAQRDREAEELQRCRRELDERIRREKFHQFLFFRQWHRLKRYCNRNDIQIMGDMPIYVCHDSADVWSHPDMFKLDGRRHPTHLAGVPPDYFSRTGQLWGNPVYDWQALRENGFAWWLQRMEQNLALYDLVRIDHFRGFVGYWEVPAGEETAVNGQWREAPCRDFFNALLRRFPALPVVAEDLGEITPDVREMIAHFGFPGMKVLLFAFGDDDPRNPFLPHNYPRNCVAYTGTHDTNTARGWFEKETDGEMRERIFRYMGRSPGADELPWEMIRLGMGSVAELMISPLQDVLGLPETARMNVPGTSEGNWRWRVVPEELDSLLAGRLADLTRIYGRM